MTDSTDSQSDPYLTLSEAGETATLSGPALRAIHDRLSRDHFHRSDIRALLLDRERLLAKLKSTNTPEWRALQEMLDKRDATIVEQKNKIAELREDIALLKALNENQRKFIEEAWANEKALRSEKENLLAKIANAPEQSVKEVWLGIDVLKRRMLEVERTLEKLIYPERRQADA